MEAYEILFVICLCVVGIMLLSIIWMACLPLCDLLSSIRANGRFEQFLNDNERFPMRPPTSSQPQNVNDETTAESETTTTEEQTEVPSCSVSVMSIACPVCLDPFQKQAPVKYLPCGHFYHKKCIDKWFKTARRSLRTPCCPTCRETYNLDSIGSSQRGEEPVP